MRLIDLDKIDVFHQEPEDVVFDIIHAIPVDAIPIEWLEEYIDNLSNEIEHYEIAGVGCGGARKQLEGVEIMLQHWRDENETKAD